MKVKVLGIQTVRYVVVEYEPGSNARVSEDGIIELYNTESKQWDYYTEGLTVHVYDAIYNAGMELHNLYNSGAGIPGYVSH